MRRSCLLLIFYVLHTAAIWISLPKVLKAVVKSAQNCTFNEIVQQSLYHEVARIQHKTKSVSSKFVKECAFAAELCNMMYSSKFSTLGERYISGSETVLSFGTDRLPDCSSILFDDGSLWVIVRGTKTLRDVLCDMTWITYTGTIGCYRIPKGIEMKTERIWPLVLENIENNVGKIKNIVFTGHSLGGAIATSLYLQFKTEFPSLSIPSKVFTFGSPLIIHKNSIVRSFAYFKIESNIHNIINQYDVFPRIFGRDSYTDIPEQDFGHLRLATDRLKLYTFFGKYYLIVGAQGLDYKLIRLLEQKSILHNLPPIYGIIMGTVSDYHHITNVVNGLQEVIKSYKKNPH